MPQQRGLTWVSMAAFLEDGFIMKHKITFRFYRPLTHLSHTFGDEWFALKAEAFARFFGTPIFLVGQTVIVAIWIWLNVAGLTSFDPYPFILLNLAFSLQAAYAAPLILLAQTRQAERDTAHALADALHREELAQAMVQRQDIATQQSEQLLALLQQNTELTDLTKQMAERIELLALQLAQQNSNRR